MLHCLTMLVVASAQCEGDEVGLFAGHPPCNLPLGCHVAMALLGGVVAYLLLFRARV